VALTLSVAEIIERNANGMLGKHPSWERVRLGDIADVQNGAAFESHYFNHEGRGMPLLRIRDVFSGKTEAFYDGPYEDTFIVHPGDLVIGMDGDFNHWPWTGPPALLNQRVCRLIFRSPHVLPKFVFYVLGGYLEAVNWATPSITVKHLSSKTVADLLLPLPPLAEQDRIVGKIERQLSRVEAGRAAFGRAATDVEELRASVLTSAVSGTLHGGDGDATALLANVLVERRQLWEAIELARMEERGKVPRDDHWKLKYAEPLSPRPLEGVELPEGWAWATVDQLATGVDYGTSAKTGSASNGVPVLRMGNIIDARLNFTDLKYLPEGHVEFPNLFLEHGDVLFTRTNGSVELVGKAAMFDEELVPCSFASYLIRVRFSHRVRPELLVHFLASPYGRRWAYEVSSQVGQANISGSKLKALTIPLPPRHVQDEICDRVEQLLDVSERLRHASRRGQVDAEALRRSILRRAVAGQLAQQHPDDEPATLLLDAILADLDERRRSTMAAKKPGRKTKVA